jgi:hypothetical protein
VRIRLRSFHDRRQHAWTQHLDRHVAAAYLSINTAKMHAIESASHRSCSNSNIPDGARNARSTERITDVRVERRVGPYGRAS